MLIMIPIVNLTCFIISLTSELFNINTEIFLYLYFVILLLNVWDIGWFYAISVIFSSIFKKQNLILFCDFIPKFFLLLLYCANIYYCIVLIFKSIRKLFGTFLSTLFSKFYIRYLFWILLLICRFVGF